MTAFTLLDFQEQDESVVIAKLLKQMAEWPGGEKQNFKLNDKLYAPKQVFSFLKTWAIRNFPHNFNENYFKEYSEAGFLNGLLSLINQRKKIETAHPNVPSEKIKAWLREMEEKEQSKEWFYPLVQIRDQETARHLEELNLEEQIKIVKDHRARLREIALNSLQKNLQKNLTGFSDDEQEEVLAKISQTIIQKTVEKGEALTQEEIKRFIEKLCEDDFLVAVSILDKDKEPLAQQFNAELTAEKSEKIINAQEKLDQAILITAPSHQGLNSMVKSSLGFEGRKADKRARSFLARVEKNWPQVPHPTIVQIQQAIRESFGVQEFIAIKKTGASEEQIAQMLSVPVKGHFQIVAAGGPFSKSTLKLAQKMGLDPTAMELWLNGISLEQIKNEQQKAKGLDKTVLEKFAEKTEKFNKAFEDESYKKIPLVHKIPFIIRKGQLGVLRFIRQNVLLKIGLYKRLPASLQIILKAKRYKLIQHAINFWVKPGKIIRGKIARPFLSRGRKLLRKGRLLRKITKSTRGKILSAAFIAGGAFLKTMGTALVVANPIKYFKNKASRFIAKTAAKTVGKILGLSATGVGAVAGAFVFIIDAFRFLKTPEAKEFIKKINPFESENVLRFVFGLSRFVYANMGALFGAGIGGAIGGLIGGPTGALMGSIGGGFLGYFIGDEFLRPIFRGGKTFLADLGISGASEAAALGKAAPGLASLAPEAAAIAEPAAAGLFSKTALLSTTAAITATAGLSAINYNNRTASYHLPAGAPEIEAPIEAQYLTLNKRAEPYYSVAAGTEITYTLTITSGSDQLTDVTVTDDIDTQYLENISVDAPGGVISWPSFNLSGTGATKTFTYTAVVKFHVEANTKITFDGTACGSRRIKNPRKLSLSVLTLSTSSMKRIK